jgi:beta-lactamase class A
MTRHWLLALLILIGLAAPGAAQQPAPAPPTAQLRAGAEQVLALLRGQAEPTRIFSAGFLAQVPEAQIRAISGQLAAQYGAPQRIGSIEAQSPTMGLVHIETQRATLHINLVVEPQPPHLITGLLLTGADMRGDSMAAIMGELRALPGQTSIAVARLGDGAPALVESHEPGRPLAIGSAFKLWVLAELSRQVQAGERRWSDVVTLDSRSIASGTLQTWPRGAPVTLHTLAALMISVSDNTATDMLIHTLGREAIERMAGTIGIASAARNRPLLSTLELSAIKTGAAPALNLWRQADEAGRRRLLANDYAAADADRIDISRFSGNPLNLDVEWYASASDMVATMDWLRRHGDDTARAILAINPAMPPAQRGDFAYIGYKGGSEPGVLNLTWLVRSRAGTWHVVTGSWNNPDAPVDEARFAGLLTRAILLLR